MTNREVREKLLKAAADVVAVAEQLPFNEDLSTAVDLITEVAEDFTEEDERDRRGDRGEASEVEGGG